MTPQPKAQSPLVCDYCGGDIEGAADYSIPHTTGEFPHHRFTHECITHLAGPSAPVAKRAADAKHKTATKETPVTKETPEKK